MKSRDTVLAYLRQAGLSTSRANAWIDRLLQEHAHELGDLLRGVHAPCADPIDPPEKTVSKKD